MKHIWKYALITLLSILVLLGAIVAIGAYSVNTLFEGMCSNNVTEKTSSPDGKKIAYQFTRDCGATTSTSYQLSILNKEDEFPNKSGNTFVSDNLFNIEWIGDRELKVTYDNSSKTYEMDKRVKSVKIDYTN